MRRSGGTRSSRPRLSLTRGLVRASAAASNSQSRGSAMSSKRAMQLCKDLIILPVDITKYKEASKEIFKIFKCYTKKIEPVSIDEAYLDVSGSNYCGGDPEEMARQIRSCIKNDFKITASAGISSNKSKPSMRLSNFK